MTKNIEGKTVSEWVEIGIKNFDSGNFQTAIESYEKALKLSPENSGIWSNIGATYEKLKNYKKEVDYCKKAVKLDPKDIWT